MRAALGVLAFVAVVWCPGACAQGAEELEVAVKVLYLSVPKQVAAEWGLDGGPPIAPEKTPLGRPIPCTLGAADARKLIAAMRETEGVSVLACATATARSGDATVVRDVQEVRLPVGTTDAGQPIFDETKDVGLAVRFSPVVLPETGRIRVQLAPELSRLVGVVESGTVRMPVVSSRTVEAEFTTESGWTRILTVSSPPDNKGGLLVDARQNGETDDRDPVTVLLVTVEFVVE